MSLSRCCRGFEACPRPSRRTRRSAEASEPPNPASPLSAGIVPGSGPFGHARRRHPDSRNTQLGYYSRAYFPVYEPRTFITSSYSGNLGYAYPTALGAKVAQPDKAVVALSGDGGFLYNSQEMATAVQYGINAVVVVFNDSAYGNVLRDQRNRFTGRTIGAELHNPDFMKLADAYGMNGVRVQTPEGLETALKQCLAHDGPSLIRYRSTDADAVRASGVGALSKRGAVEPDDLGNDAPALR